MDEGLATPSGRGERRKTLSVKARAYKEIQENLKKLEIEHDSSSDIFAESGSSDSSLLENGEDSSSESEVDNSDELEVDSDEEEQFKGAKAKILLPYKKPITKNVGTRKHSTQSYTIKAEDYFYHHSLKKSTTSNHTLDKLKKARLSQEELEKVLSNLSVTNNHNEHLTGIYSQIKNDFDKWMCLLHEGFNILLYGLGSKRSILHNFHQEYLRDFPVIVVNGFFPSLTIKEILEAIMVEILEIDVLNNLFEACDVIRESFQCQPNLHLHIIIHNIEAEMLRVNLKNQTILANLAAVKNIHLITSIDHINAPLIWDQNKLSMFNFIWWDATTFLPYKEETSFESSMMLTKTGSLALSSLRNVFLSLTSNSKGIFLIIAQYQLQNAAQFYQGLLFKDLYRACREVFLVSSDLALRAQLTEFVDHKMVKFRRSADGAEYVIIPIPNNLLQQFLNDQ